MFRTIVSRITSVVSLHQNDDSETHVPAAFYRDHLANGGCLRIIFDFSGIDTYVVDLDGELYSSDSDGHTFTQLTESEFVELVTADTTMCSFVGFDEFPYPVEENNFTRTQHPHSASPADHATVF